jgi:hypothetical protein
MVADAVLELVDACFSDFLIPVAARYHCPYKNMDYDVLKRSQRRVVTEDVQKMRG